MRAPGRERAFAAQEPSRALLQARFGGLHLQTPRDPHPARVASRPLPGGEVFRKRTMLGRGFFAESIASSASGAPGLRAVVPDAHRHRVRLLDPQQDLRPRSACPHRRRGRRRRAPAGLAHRASRISRRLAAALGSGDPDAHHLGTGVALRVPAGRRVAQPRPVAPARSAPRCLPAHRFARAALLRRSQHRRLALDPLRRRQSARALSRRRCQRSPPDQHHRGRRRRRVLRARSRGRVDGPAADALHHLGVARLPAADGAQVHRRP